MLYLPLYYDRIYIACITMFMFTCKHMHSVFNNMTSAAIYFGVCELSYAYKCIIYHREVATSCVSL
jgi:hypothetical protein